MDFQVVRYAILVDTPKEQIVGRKVVKTRLFWPVTGRD